MAWCLLKSPHHIILSLPRPSILLWLTCIARCRHCRVSSMLEWQQSLYMLKIVTRPLDIWSWTAVMSFVSAMWICIQLFTSSAALSSITDLHVTLLARCEVGYTTCHCEFALVFPSLSIYGSWSARMSQLLCSGVLIKS